MLQEFADFKEANLFLRVCGSYLCGNLCICRTYSLGLDEHDLYHMFYQQDTVGLPGSLGGVYWKELYGGKASAQVYCR